MELDKIGGMTQGDLRRFIVNLLLSDPGAIPRRAASVSTSPLTTKGDIYTRNVSEDDRLPVGTDGFVLTADSASPTGNKWAAAGVTTPTGTGFPHVTAGVYDAAAKLVDTADINADQVTYPKIQNVAANNRVLGRVSGAGGDIEELTGLQVAALVGVSTPTGTGFTHETAGVTDAAAKLVDTADINLSQVTYSRVQNIVANNVVLGNTAGAGNPIQEITMGNLGALLPIFGTLSQGLVPGSGGGTSNFLRADGTWTVPADLTLPGEALDPGSVTLTTERFLIQSGQMKLSGSEQFTLQGTTELVLTDMPGHLENIRGVPRSMFEPIVVPNEHDYTVYSQLTLRQTGQLELRGTAQLILSDDMGTPGQLTLAGRI